MLAAKLNLTIQQGATFRKRLVWRTSNNRPINLTGYEAKLQARATATDPVVLFELSTRSGTIKLGGSNGVIELLLSDEATAQLQFDRGVYDLFLYAPNGDALRLLEGTVRLVRGVTKA